MPVRPLVPAALVAAVFSLSLAIVTTSANAYDCEAQVNSQLQELGISQSDVESAKLTRRSRGARSSSNYSYDAWVRLKSCSEGALVVHMTNYCMVQNVYTTGDCRVGDLPSY